MSPLASRTPPAFGRARRAAGVVLLEVVLAITLFVSTAAVVLGALNASTRADAQLALQATAMDRAVSVMSQLELKILPLTDAGPTACAAPFDNWTWQVTLTPITLSAQAGNMQQVQVVVRNDEKDYQLALTQLMPDAAAGGGS